MQYFSYLDKREVLQQEYSQPTILPYPHFRWVVNRMYHLMSPCTFHHLGRGRFLTRNQAISNVLNLYLRNRSCGGHPVCDLIPSKDVVLRFFFDFF